MIKQVSLCILIYVINQYFKQQDTMNQQLAEKQLSHLQFTSRFKFIRHEKNPQLFSFLLMRDIETKRTALVKNYIYDSKEELSTILKDYQQLLNIYEHHSHQTLNTYFCDFIGFCLQKQNDDELIYLIYDYHHETLDEVIGFRKLHSNRQNTKNRFSEEEIECLLDSSLKAVSQLEKFGMNFLCWSFKYILVQNLGHINMKFRLLFTPFIMDAVDEIQNEKPDVEQYFLSEIQLRKLSAKDGQQSTFTEKILSDKQSLGLMALKLATIAHEEDRFYEMNQNFELVWNSEGLKRRFEILSKNYSQQIVRKIEYLIFDQNDFYSFQDMARSSMFVDDNIFTFSEHKKHSRQKSWITSKSKRSRVSPESNKSFKHISYDRLNISRYDENQFSSIKKINERLEPDKLKNYSPSKYSNISDSATKLKKDNYESKLSLLQNSFMEKIPKQTMHRLEDPKIGETYLGQTKNGLKNGLGINYNRQGDVYFGEWANDQMNGEGTYLFKNSDVYSGSILKGLKHGRGKYEHWNGNIYEGDWTYDLKNGYGRYDYFNKGDSYVGEFVNNMREGRGEYKWKNGSRYEGNFLQGYKQGSGIAYLEDGTKVEGYWQKDKLQGNSIRVIYPSQKEYRGSIDQQILNGDGEQIHQSNRCKGKYLKNKRCGYFQIEYPNGDKYKGQFYEDKPHGRGEYQYAQNKIRFIGFWDHGLQEGQGTIIFPNQTQIQCNWKKGEYEKIGKIKYPNGDEYCGQINQLGRNGRGVYVNSSGKSYKGVFKNGVLIQIQ